MSLKVIFFRCQIFFSLLLLAGCMKPLDEGNNTKQDSHQASAINTQLGLDYLDQGNLPLAKEKLLLALKQDKDSISAISAMAYYQEVSGNLPEAEKEYLKAINLSAVKGGAQNNYGAFLCRQKRYKLAETYFLKAVADPDYVNTGRAYENAGLCAQSNGEASKARDYFKKALSNDPTLSSSMRGLANLEADLKNYANAYEQIKNYLLLKKEPSAKELLFAARLASITRDQAGAKNYGALLKDNFPGSPEYQQYLQLKKK